MEAVGRSVRLIVGLGMVAAGTTLAAPTALFLVDWARASPSPALPAPPSITERPAPAEGVPAMAMPGLTVQPGPLTDRLPEVHANMGRPAAGVSDRYRPPPPPAPLPPPTGGLAAAGPDLSLAYRSTLDAPPPPLIDGQRPPPMAIGWTVRGGRDPSPGRAPLPPPAATYRIRDGDDLTAIASRFYGTPAAARLIWDANRGRLADPAVLPIGIELVLPHPGAIGAAGDRGLEPVFGQPALPSPAPTPPASSWLGSPS